MHVADYMTTKVVTANLRDGLHQTFHRMHERDIRHMPVVGDKGALVGVISDRDLRRPESVDAGPNTTSYYRLDNELKVADAMTTEPITVNGSDDVSVAIDHFVNRKFGALPVVDDSGALIGVLSAYDLLRAFKDYIARG